MHADGGDFALAHPDARQFGNTAGLDAEIRQSIDQGLFDGPHVGSHIALPFAQVEDGIAHDLSGAVIGDVAAAIGRVEGDAGARQNVVAGQQVFQMPVAPQRDDMRVLQQEELIRDQPLLAIAREPLLEFQRAGVIDSPELAQAAAMH